MKAADECAVLCRCLTCRREFGHAKPGRVPDYCSNACRQRAFYWRYVERYEGLRYKQRARKPAMALGI